jgi:hypothetical protein
MTSPLQVDPNDLLVIARGHLLLISQLGQVRDLTPDVSGGPWPSQAAVASIHGAAAAVTGQMMTRLGEHSATLTANAGQYQAQETSSAAKLDPKDLAQMTSQFMQAGAQAGSQMTQGLMQGVSQLGQMGASLTNQLAQGGVSTMMTVLSNGAKMMPSPAAHVDVVKPDTVTPAAGAPAAGVTDKTDDGTQTEVQI